jgi:hypothetical protein
MLNFDINLMLIYFYDIDLSHGYGFRVGYRKELFHIPLIRGIFYLDKSRGLTCIS